MKLQSTSFNQWYSNTSAKDQSGIPISLPVLLFHSIAPDKSEYISITPQHFSDLVELLVTHYNPVTLAQAVDHITGKNPLPKRSVMITFDDGYEDNFLFARPILLTKLTPAVFFIPPMFLGGNNLWNPKADHIRQHLSKDQILQLAQDGFEIGSHSLTHHKLTKFDSSVLKKELVESRMVLEGILQQPVPWFAYPYGAYDERISRLTASVYDLAFATGSGMARWNDMSFSAIKRHFVGPQHTSSDLQNILDALIES